VARQNFQHGKRQRELAKKQKREEKLQRKLDKKNNPSLDSGGEEAGSEDQEVQPEAEP
jgi:hypothetical protein